MNFCLIITVSLRLKLLRAAKTQSEDANGDTQSTQQTQATQDTSATEQTTAPDAVQSQAVQGSETADDAEQSEINSNGRQVSR